MTKKENMFHSIISFLALPIRIIFPHHIVNKIGLISLYDQRVTIVRSHCQSKLLDIGCGTNKLLKEYGHEIIGVVG